MKQNLICLDAIYGAGEFSAYPSLRQENEKRRGSDVRHGPQSLSSVEAWLMVEDIMRWANATGQPSYRRAAERMMDAYFARCETALMLLELGRLRKGQA